MLTYFTEITCLSLALFFGWITWRRLDKFFRILVLQVSLWSLVYTVGHLITLNQQHHNQPIDNQWLMNIHMIFETGLLLLAARFVNRETKNGLLIQLGTLAFVIVYAIQVIYNGFQNYLHYADLTECVVITLVYTPILFTAPIGKKGRPLRIVCVALLLYFACSIPYVSLMNYLQVHSPKLNSMLYHVISDVLANLRYLLIALAFVSHYRNNRNERIVK